MRKFFQIIVAVVCVLSLMWVSFYFGGHQVIEAELASPVYDHTSIIGRTFGYGMLAGVISRICIHWTHWPVRLLIYCVYGVSLLYGYNTSMHDPHTYESMIKHFSVASSFISTAPLLMMLVPLGGGAVELLVASGKEWYYGNNARPPT